MQKINKDKFNTGVVFRVGVLTNQIPTAIIAVKYPHVSVPVLKSIINNKAEDKNKSRKIHFDTVANDNMEPQTILTRVL